MQSSTQEITPILGTAMAGGYYAGRIRLDDGSVYALIVAPKAEGEHKPTPWIGKSKDIPGSKSYNDGFTNTNALADSGSKLAKWARELRIDGHDDWYLPSQDELEVIYRNLEPSIEKNWSHARSGINLSAVMPTRPYTPASPAQTLAEVFQADGTEAFDKAWYWTSTQHIAEPSEAVEWRELESGELICTAYVPSDQPIPAPRCAFTVDMFDGIST
jgi:hypothetical protein